MAVSVWTRVDVMADRMRVCAVAVIGAGVEPAAPPVGGEGSTRTPTTPRSARRTVSFVTIPYALRSFGVAAFATIVATIFATDPTPGLSGDGLWVTLALAGMAAGVTLARPWRAMPDAQRIAGVLLIAVAGIVLTAVQPKGAGSAAVYLV